MHPVALLLAAVVFGGAWALLRTRGRARHRAQEAAAEFERFVAGLAGWSAEREGDGWQLARRGRPLGQLSRSEVLAIAERADRRAPARRCDAWGARLCLLASPLVPLAGPLSLKLHGPRLLPRPAHPETVLALPEREPPAVGRSPGLAWPLLYVIAGSEPAAYLPEAAVREAGIDVRALHGVAIAVLRQRLDPRPVERALAGEVVEVRPADGCGAARLLLLPELLAPGQRLAALALDPATLLLAPPAEGERLAARVRAGGPEPREALLDAVLEVSAEGVAVAAR